MTNTKVANNVVYKPILRKVQSNTLKELSGILYTSFGPNGSNACIKRENALSRYTKDGHSIIGAISYNGMIEQSIKEDIESITRHIVKTVGDGTTSAVILSSSIFDGIAELETNKEYEPAQIIKSLNKVVSIIKDEIMSNAKEFTSDDAYDIAMISSNGNEFISKTIKDIYDEYGNGVFIDVSPSMNENTYIKSYNGMTLNTGYSDSCFVTNTKNNTCEVDHPEVYFFEHPIDTKELGVYLDSIISRNIITPANSGNYDQIIPTVIFAPTISQDMSGAMDSLVNAMAQMPASNKFPICIVTSYHETDQLADLAKMCGAKMIRKYIDANIYKSDVEAGIAPTPETIFKWAGSCDRVVSYSDKTIFVRPSKIFNEDGSYSELYKNLLRFLETEISRTENNETNLREAGTLKRRLHSLKSNMVELFVGGITQADRDSLRDLVEDSVLNVRSAAQNGVGLAGNVSAVKAIESDKLKCMFDNHDNPESTMESLYNDSTSLESNIFKIIQSAYKNIIDILFRDIKTDSNDVYSIVAENAKNDMVFNIRDREFSSNVKTSIMSDIVILDAVSKIIGIMATCNIMILPSAMHNIYTE